MPKRWPLVGTRRSFPSWANVNIPSCFILLVNWYHDDGVVSPNCRLSRASRINTPKRFGGSAFKMKLAHGMHCEGPVLDDVLQPILCAAGNGL
jgi:hypothetical protein